MVRKFRRCRSRNALICGSSVGPSDAAIPREIVIVAVLVAVAVRLVVLFVVADQVVQGETIVRGDEIDAGVRASPIVLV